MERVLDDGDQFLNLLVGELTSTLGEVDSCLFADEIDESATAALHLSERKSDLALAIDVRVENTKDVSKVLVVLHHERHPCSVLCALLGRGQSVL